MRRRKPPGATTRGGWGNHHQRRRAAIAPLVNAGKATCARCHEPIHAGEEWHLDHNDTRDGYLGVSHATCNLRDGASKTNGTAPPRPLCSAALPMVTTVVRQTSGRHGQPRRRTHPEIHIGNGEWRPLEDTSGGELT